MGKTLKDAPVVCAIAQILHNPITKIDDYADSIQDCMRLAGLPGYQASLQFAIRMPAVSIQGIASEVPKVDQFNRLIFTDTALTQALIVDMESFTFITTDYVNFEDFQSNFSKYLAAFEKVISLHYIERVGVRYIDVFTPIEEGVIGSSVVVGVLGLSEHLKEAPIMYTTSETRFLLHDGDSVLTRTTLKMGEFGLPVGVELPFLKIPQKFMNINGLYVTIDTDCTSEGRVPFDRSKLLDKIDSLHKGAGVAFRATVTPEALEAWK